MYVYIYICIYFGNLQHDNPQLFFVLSRTVITIQNESLFISDSNRVTWMAGGVNYKLAYII
jgi:hypothetical protein